MDRLFDDPTATPSPEFMHYLWNATRRELQRQVGEALFSTHFAEFVPVKLDADALTIASTDEMAALIVEKNYSAVLARCVQTAAGREMRVHIDPNPPAPEAMPKEAQQLSLFDAPAPVAETPPIQANTEPTQRLLIEHVAEPFIAPQVMTSPGAAAPQVPTETFSEAVGRSNLTAKFHLNSFVVGGSNEFAYEAARAVVEKPGGLYNPLFLYGGVGLGKTHLMNAVGLGILRNQPRARVRYISAETFVNELIESIGARKMDEFRQKNRIDVDVLLIDDIQFIGGKERTQEEFFHTFNALYQAGRQIVITSDRIPQEMPELEERLMSRLSMGLLADIQPPDYETRVAILQKQAKELRFDVPTPVYEYIAQQVRSNVRELHGALLRIGTYARLRHEPISLSVAQTQLERVHRDRTGSLTPEMILKMTAETFGVTVRDIKGRKRAATVATPRKVAMFLSRSYTNASFPELGAFFGGRDHTTVMSAVKSVEKLLAANDPVRHRIEAIERRLGRAK
ncbi:MAG: chromosomal replication initiator protein [Bradymonadia bacterium]